jgi:DNA polymerase-3 subunit epsilon
MPGLLLARLRNRLIRTRLRGKKLHPFAQTNLKALDQISRNQSAKNLRYVVLDLETTGLSLTRDRVVSVAAYRIVDGRILLGNMFNSLVSPGRDIPSSAVKIHGIMPSMVADAPLFADVFEQLLRFLGTDILVGYHVQFDLNFLNIYMRQNHGFPIQNLVLDAKSICRKICFPAHLRSYAKMCRSDQSLDSMARHFCIEIQKRHTAVGDALATAMIFQRILVEMEKAGVGRLKNLLSMNRGV